MSDHDHIGSLRPDPMNPRRHTPRNVGTIANLLQRRGFGRSILISKGGQIIAGHATVDAAASVGIEKLRVVETTGDEVVALMRIDVEDGSAEAAELGAGDNFAADLADGYDPELLRQLNEKFEMAEWGLWNREEWAAALAPIDEPNVGLTDPDVVPEPPAEPVTRPGDLWRLGNHRLLCGDATVAADIEWLMAGDKADMVFTDPPYGVDYDGGSGNTKKRERQAGDDRGLYAEWLPLWRLYAEDSTPFYVWFADRHGRRTYDAVEDAGLSVRALIVWNKVDAHYGGYLAQYMQKHEPCLYCHIGVPRWYGPTNEVTVWDVQQPSTNDFHPTQKPTALAERAIRNSSKANDLILDLFGGSGSTLIACEQTDRRCAMMEIDPTYCDVIVRRWEHFTGQSAVLLGDRAGAS